MRWLAVVLALAACTDPAEPLDDDTRATYGFREQLAQLDRESTEYLGRMTAATDTTCVAVRNQYYLVVDPIIRFRLTDLAPGLDQTITDRGGAAFADLTCVTEALAAELQAHLALECTVNDIAAEAERHVDAVGALVDAGYARTDELLAGSMFTATPVPCP
jgi:hypothetical protein